MTGKVQSISIVEQLVKKGTEKQLSKQDFVIAYGAGTCRGVAWEQVIGTLKVDSCFKIMNATVQSFNGLKYLSLGERSLVQDVEDIGYVANESSKWGDYSYESRCNCCNKDRKLSQLQKTRLVFCYGFRAISSLPSPLQHLSLLC